MKINTLTVIVAAGLLAVGTAFAGNGQGYGGPPQSAEEREARQGDCVGQNGGVCPQDGPRGERQGNGQGNQHRRGARDGSGPRGGTGACPANQGTGQR